MNELLHLAFLYFFPILSYPILYEHQLSEEEEYNQKLVSLFIYLSLYFISITDTFVTSIILLNILKDASLEIIILLIISDHHHLESKREKESNIQSI